MDALKKIFPISFKRAGSVSDLVIGIIIYIVIGIVVGALISLATLLTGWIPVVGVLLAWLLGIVSSIVGIWTLAGLVVLILAFLKILK